MSDDNTANVPPTAEGSGGLEPSRRGFMYGTAAAAAGAALSSRIPGSSRRPRSLTGGPARPAGQAAAGAGVPPPAGGAGWAFLQAGAPRHGTGSVAVTMNAGSAGGTLLVAILLSTDPQGAFSPPATQAGWRLARAVKAAPGGRAEIWYYPGTPPSPGSPAGITAATFTSTSTADCRGAMAEFRMPTGTMPVLDSPGKASGKTGGFSLTAASGNIAGDLGIAMAAGFFDGPVPSGSGWTGPSGWTGLQELDSGAADPWAAWYDLSLAAGIQSLSAVLLEAVGGFNVPVQTAWAFGYAAFRAVRFQALHLDGSEVTTMVALDPTGQELVMGGDVEGIWRTADFGDHWQLSQDGLYGMNWRCTAAVDWSQLEAGVVYACAGKHTTANGGGDGGFLASTDGGVTWTMRSTTVQFQGNVAEVRPTGEGTDTDRSVGRLLAQDPQPPGKPSYLYAATYSNGVYQSSDAGHTWSNIGGLDGGKYFLRAIVLNPANTSEMWVGAWDYGPTHSFGGVFHTPDVTKTAFAQMEGFPTSSGAQIATVSDLLVTGGYLYALSTTNGLFRRQIGGTGGWKSLNVAPITLNAGGPIWTGVDGYLDQATGNHVIVVTCGDGVRLGTNPNFTHVVKVTVDAAGNATGVDLTGTAQINHATIPPDDHGFWRATSGYHNWLGGNNFHNAHVLIDPDNHSRVFVTGAGGFFRTANADADPASIIWDMAVNGAPMAAAHLIVVDPNDTSGTHVVIAGSDFTQTDLTDPTAWDTSKVHSPGGLGAGKECHALTFDPNSNIFTGVNDKYGQNSGGAVLWRASSDTTFTWNDTKYSGHTANAPMGIYAAIDPAGPFQGLPFAVVVAQGLGMVRGVPSEPTMTQKWNWGTVSTAIGTHGDVAQQCAIVAGAIAGHLYCYDRAQGIFRSADYGKTWSSAPIWSLAGNGLTVSDARSGWVATNPTASGDELWVSTNDPGGLFKLTVGSGGAVTITPMGGTSFPNGAGGIVFNRSGQPYVVALPGPLPKNPLSSARLLTLPAGTSTWTDAGGDSIGSYASWPTCVTMTTKGLILIASDEDFGVYGFPLA